MEVHRSIFAIALFGMALVSFACTKPSTPTPEEAASTEASTELPVIAKIPDFSLTDETGEAWGSDDTTGKVWVADFIFTRCPTTCPIQTSMMKKLQEKLREMPHWDDIRLVSFSVDPGYDQPDVLQTYAKDAGAEPGHWKFLTGTRDAIWDLSNEGFKLAAGEPAEGDGPLFHSTKFVLLDSDHEIRGYYDGVTEEGIDSLASDIQAHWDELASPKASS